MSLVAPPRAQDRLREVEPPTSKVSLEPVDCFRTLQGKEHWSRWDKILHVELQPTLLKPWDPALSGHDRLSGNFAELKS